MYSLEDKKIRDNLILVFQFIKQGDLERIYFLIWIQNNYIILNEINHHLTGKGVKHFFYNKIINKWKNLPLNNINAVSITDFRRKYIYIGKSQQLATKLGFEPVVCVEFVFSLLFDAIVNNQPMKSPDNGFHSCASMVHSEPKSTTRCVNIPLTYLPFWENTTKPATLMLCKLRVIECSWAYSI